MNEVTTEEMSYQEKVALLEDLGKLYQRIISSNKDCVHAARSCGKILNVVDSIVESLPSQ